MELSFYKDHKINLKNLNSKKNYYLTLELLGYKYVKKPHDLILLLGWESKIKNFLSNILSKIINFRYKELTN